MKETKITCDICKKEGAREQRKEAKHLVASVEALKSQKIDIDGKGAVPYISLSYSKRESGGQIVELDLCKDCKAVLEQGVAEEIVGLYDRAKHLRAQKKSRHK